MIGAITAGIFSAGTAPVTNSYESISTVTVGSGGASSITFSSIPSTYKHLQVRGFKKNGGVAWITGQINGDTGNNYAYHELRGDGSSASASSGTGANVMYMSLTDNTVGGLVVDILDYTNANKNKTLRTLSGSDANGSAFIQLVSNLWLSTSAITSISFIGSFQQYSSFALYGIKG